MNLFNSFKSALVIVGVLLLGLYVQQAHAWGNNNQYMSGSVYSGQESMQYQRVRVGVVEDVRTVEIRTESQSAGYVGAGIGSVLGGIGSQMAGRGRGRTVAMGLGAMAGGLIGNYVGTAAGRDVRYAVEVIVTIGNETVAITQPLDEVAAQLTPGTRVRLIEGQAVRVVPIRSM